MPRKTFVFTMILAIFLLSGCAVPMSVEPLPYYRINSAGTRVETAELCRLYVKYGFMDDQNVCEAGTAKRIKINEANLKSNEYIARRNDLQNEILGVATDRCTEFKNRIQRGPRDHLMTVGTIALLLSAGATANTGELATKLTSSATAFTSFGQLMDESYSDSVPDIIQGIEIARTRIFRNIRDSLKRDLIEYPLSRAVNDALRYHAVCNIAEGSAEASRATSEAAAAEQAETEPPTLQGLQENLQSLQDDLQTLLGTE